MVTKKRFLPVLALAAAMLVLVAYAAWSQSGQLLKQVRFVDSPRGQTLNLHYDAEADSYILFLPGYVSAEDVTADCPKGISVRYDGNETMPSAQEMELQVSSLFRSQRVTLRMESVGQIPSVFVEAEEGLLPYLNADKENVRDVVVRIRDGAGQTMLQSTASMYGRGNGSWDSPSKKPYNLEFPREVSVGPFENVTRIAMLAEHSDESKLRNSLAYFAGQELGVDYASPYQYANLFVNGEYIGLYGLVTKQEYKNYLVSDSIQAVFEIATGHNRVEFQSSLGWRINVMHGTKDQVYTLVSELEEALSQGDWEKTASMIDVESFAQKYALEEFLANLDMCYASQYFYLGADNKIHCMLPWDYDWTLGSSYQYYNNRQVNELKVLRDGNAWYSLLLEQQPFRQAVVAALEGQFDDAFLKKLENHLLSSIDAIGPAWQSDQLRWRNEPAYNAYDLASGVEELPGFYDLFRNFFYDRRAFLIDFYRNPGNYRCLRFYDARWGNLFVPLGTDLQDYLEGATILDVNVPGEEFLGWYIWGEYPLAEAGILEEDLSVRGYYAEMEPQENLLWQVLPEIGIVLSFVCLALGIFLKSCAAWKVKQPQ